MIYGAVHVTLLGLFGAIGNLDEEGKQAAGQRETRAGRTKDSGVTPEVMAPTSDDNARCPWSASAEKLLLEVVLAKRGGSRFKSLKGKKWSEISAVIANKHSISADGTVQQDGWWYWNDSERGTECRRKVSSEVHASYGAVQGVQDPRLKEWQRV
jgi:hypothetical protein